MQRAYVRGDDAYNFDVTSEEYDGDGEGRNPSGIGTFKIKEWANLY